jgi:hypothetical protein
LGFISTEILIVPLLVPFDGESAIQLEASLAVQFKLDVIVTDCVSSFAENSETEDTSKFSISTSSLESLELQVNRTVKTKNAKTMFNNFIAYFFTKITPI